MYRGIEKLDTIKYIADIPFTNVSHNKRFGIIDNDTRYEPNRALTRAEFIKMIVRALACKYEFIGTKSSFYDVNPDEWYAEYIAFAEQAGWIHGYSKNEFRPNASISRSEVALVLSRVLSIQKSDIENKNIYADITKTQPFSDAVLTLTQYGVIDGQEINGKRMYRPDDAMLRAEGAKVLVNIFLKDLKKKGVPQ
jgi:hypothetical protein